MKAVVLSAVPPERRTVRAALAVLDWELEKLGYETITRFDVAQTHFCKGDFDCSVGAAKPCAAHHSEEAAAEAVAGADALVLVGAIARGGLDPALERAVERLLYLVPRKRAAWNDDAPLPAYLTLCSVGVLPSRDDAQASTFRALNDANAVSFRAGVRRAAVLDEEHTELWQEQLKEVLGGEEPPASPSRRAAGRALVGTAPSAPAR